MSFLLFLLLATNISNAYKILLFSAPLGYSHIQFMGRIADILQEAGHDVTVLHPVGAPKYLHAVSKSAKQIIVYILFNLPEKIHEGLDPKNYNFWDVNSKAVWRQISMFNYHVSLQVEACDLLMGDNETITELRKAKFDVGITEIIAQCGLGLFEQIGLNHMIATSSLGLVDSMAEFYDAPRLPSFVPSFLLAISARMNFLERTMNFLISLLSDVAIKSSIIREHKKVFARHGVIGNEDDFYRKTNYLLSNSDEFLENARPTTAKIIHIGGIASSKQYPLNDEFQELMDRSDRVGAVYISFGSVVPTKEMPEVFREAIIHVVEAFPKITFMWKVDKEDSIPKLANLHAFAWLPQQALLDHPRLLCFISHAGLNSVLEVARSGKPSILVPIFGDQFRNARLVEAKNTTIVLSKENFNNQTFKETLRRILSDDSFVIRAKRLASLMNNKPFPVKDRLLSTIEFSIQHGKIEDLDSYGRNLNTLQYYSIDVIAFLVILVIICITVTIQLLKFCLTRVTIRKVKID